MPHHHKHRKSIFSRWAEKAKEGIEEKFGIKLEIKKSQIISVISFASASLFLIGCALAVCVSGK